MREDSLEMEQAQMAAKSILSLLALKVLGSELWSDSHIAYMD